MGFHAGAAPAGGARTAVSPFSRIYGLGSVYAKALRDSRLAIIIMSGLLGGMFLATGVAFAEAYATAASRAELATLVGSLPPIMVGIYGNPFPGDIARLGGTIAWKAGGSLALIACLWSVLALGGTLASEARRGSLDLVAATPLGMRRIALEKLGAHLTGMGIVVVVTALCGILTGAAFTTLPGDEIPAQAAIGFALWIGIVALAAGSVAFALSPLLGRGAATAIAGAVTVFGYFANGYQVAVPAFGPLANLTWFGWTAHHQPLTGTLDWPSLVPCALLAVVLFAAGIALFERRDIGVTARVPWPAMPGSLLGLRGPAGRSLGERMPNAVAWATGIGLFGFVLAGASSSFGDTLATSAPDIRQVFQQIFPTVDLTGAGAFLQLTFITFGLILAGFAAATLVNGWASDENEDRLELLLSTPMSRTRWALLSGLGLYAAIGLLTVILMVWIGLGAVIAGGDAVTPVAGTIVIGLYALALAGIGLAFGGLVTTSFAGEAVAVVVIVTFLVDFLVPALDMPDWIRQLALTSHLGQPMVGTWDWPGMIGCVAIGVGGLLLGAWGLARRDVER